MWLLRSTVIECFCWGFCFCIGLKKITVWCIWKRVRCMWGGEVLWGRVWEWMWGDRVHVWCAACRMFIQLTDFHTNSYAIPQSLIIKSTVGLPNLCTWSKFVNWFLDIYNQVLWNSILWSWLLTLHSYKLALPCVPVTSSGDSPPLWGGFWQLLGRMYPCRDGNPILWPREQAKDHMSLSIFDTCIFVHTQVVLFCDDS